MGIADEFILRIREQLGHVPTADQEHAMGVVSAFLMSRERSCMVMRGSAGTGKTTLASAVVRALRQSGHKLVLLAPTGRAAKVFTQHSGQPAYTIHRRIYRQKSTASLSAFALNDNLYRDTLFIIDEASMITAVGGDTTFGSGSVLSDLVNYVYSGSGCRMMLLGDTAQLPPVGEDEPMALQAGVLQSLGLGVYECDLNEVLRQGQHSGILWNATRLRQAVLQQGDGEAPLPVIRFTGFPDIVSVPGGELIEALASSYGRVGVDETMVVTRSNKRAVIYNRGIRNTVLDREEELCRGDQLMIVKNNYFWLNATLRDAEDKPTKESVFTLSFLANGDRCVVQRVRHVRELYGLRFADVTLQLPDYPADGQDAVSGDAFELTATVLLDTLTAEAPALTSDQQSKLFENVMEDYADIPLASDRMKALRNDPHYNALQVKYGYAVTCHKAQGGQWAHVYIDQGYISDDTTTSDYHHWLYTALTRATEKVFLVNWPDNQRE